MEAKCSPTVAKMTAIRTCTRVSLFSPSNKVPRKTHAKAPNACCRSILALISNKELTATLRNVNAAIA